MMIRTTATFALILFLSSSCWMIQSFVVVNPTPRLPSTASSTTARHFFLGLGDNDNNEKNKANKQEQYETTPQSEKNNVEIGDSDEKVQQSKDSKRSTSNSSSNSLVPKITTISSLDEFLDFIQQDDRLCIIKFHAAWCKSCQKFGVQYRHLAMEDADKMDRDGQVVSKGTVRFAQIEFGANTILCKSLGIKRLPTVHFYKQPYGKLTGFPCGPKKIDILCETLEEYKAMTDEELKLKKELEEGEALLDTIADDIKKTSSSKQQQQQ